MVTPESAGSIILSNQNRQCNIFIEAGMFFFLQNKYSSRMATTNNFWGVNTGSAGPIDRFADVLSDRLLKIRGSFLLFIATVSFVLVVLELVWSKCILSGIFGIWGRKTLIYAGLAFLYLIGYR